jgi:ubiquinone/menaquinone biosynthesis C-methylase UbiE
MTSTTDTDRSPWGADFFGALATMPTDAVDLIAGVLEAMRTQPAFREARRFVISQLGLAAGATVLEAGCGTGCSLPDVMEVAGDVRLTGVDPTDAFLERARTRATELGGSATYENADARALPFDDASFDASFCDKLLLHVGPATAVLGEMARVTRPGGRVGVVEWCPTFCLSTSRPELASALNEGLRRAVYDHGVAPNLARHLDAAGLREIRTSTHLATARSLSDHPFWRAFLLDQLPMFVHGGVLGADEADALAADLGALDRRGLLWAAVTVFAATGTRP